MTLRGFTFASPSLPKPHPEDRLWPSSLAIRVRHYQLFVCREFRRLWTSQFRSIFIPPRPSLFSSCGPVYPRLTEHCRCGCCLLVGHILPGVIWHSRCIRSIRKVWTWMVNLFLVYISMLPWSYFWIIKIYIHFRFLFIKSIFFYQSDGGGLWNAGIVMMMMIASLMAIFILLFIISMCCMFLRFYILSQYFERMVAIIQNLLLLVIMMIGIHK